MRVSDSEIVASYEKTLSAYKTAESLGINWKTVYNALARQGVSAKGLAHYRKTSQKYPPEIQDKILQLYAAGVNTPELKRQFGGSASSIRQAIVRNGGAMRKPPGRPADVPQSEASAICESYARGMALTALSSVYRHSHEVIVAILRRNNVAIRGQWKNSRAGEYRHKRTGYVWIKLDASDPLYCMSGVRGLVMEHRLAMARKLGRPLLSTETVHHIDGNRENNEPDNLQLRQGRHGKHVVMCCADCGSRNVTHAEIEG